LIVRETYFSHIADREQNQGDQSDFLYISTTLGTALSLDAGLPVDPSLRACYEQLRLSLNETL
jgi:hypothetical protein